MTYVPWDLLGLVGNKPPRPRYHKKRVKIGIRLVLLKFSVVMVAKDDRVRHNIFKNFMAILKLSCCLGLNLPSN